MQVNAEELRSLLDLANDMRRAKGDDKLEDLPVSIPADGNQCLVARAFNYSCTVDPESAEITFKTQEDRDTYLSVMNIELHSTADLYDMSIYSGWVDDAGNYYSDTSAPLTNLLVELAENFDAHIYPEYEVQRDENGAIIDE